MFGYRVGSRRSSQVQAELCLRLILGAKFFDFEFLIIVVFGEANADEARDDFIKPTHSFLQVLVQKYSQISLPFFVFTVSPSTTTPVPTMHVQPYRSKMTLEMMVLLSLTILSLIISPVTAVTTWSCQNTAGLIRISDAHARAVARNAPAPGTPSGYPHTFNNFVPDHKAAKDTRRHGHLENPKRVKGVPAGQVTNHRGYIFPNKGCNSPRASLLEYPVFGDVGVAAAAVQQYDPNVVPRARPGAARAIYTTAGTFCGVIAHVDGPAGELKLCKGV
ncbi:hypothetical protein HDU97_002878 [Phlyctochytrium planicorne]|nr:hypothetical protein HDU97_002878 [Phlyctochytrium planicorne]